MNTHKNNLIEKTDIIHPTLARMQARAAQLGSSSTTSKGISKYLRSHPLTDPESISAKGRQLINHRNYRLMIEFRRTLNRGRVGERCQPQRLIRAGYVGAAIQDEELMQAAYQMLARKNPRKRNIYLGAACIDGPAAQERHKVIEYRGRYKGYRGDEIHCDYQSGLLRSRSGRSAVLVQSCLIVRRIIAPSGMIWATDKIGHFLRRLSDGMDYHPSLDDLRARDFVGRIRAGMAVNYRARVETNKIAKESARAAAIFARDLRTTRITLDDSRRAGNCIEGSLRFAEARLGLDRADLIASRWLIGVPAERLIKAAALEQKANVDRAVQQAWLRETTVSI